MKIIHIVLGKANPDRMNGVNKVVHSLATHQSMLSAYVDVWGITETPLATAPDRMYNTRFFQSGALKWKLDSELKRAITLTEPDTVFHLHAGFIPEFYALSKELYKTRRRYVITPHGNYMKGAMVKNHFVKSVYFKLFEQFILKHAFFIHCIGFGEIDDIKTIYEGNNIKLIPNGQDFDSFEFPFKQIENSKHPIFGFCGRVTMYQKGLDLLLEGFKIYKSSMHGIGDLWLIGDGDYKNSILKFSLDNGLRDSIKIYGSKFGEEKLNLMANMDVFYHPSRNEGLPMAVLEAAVLGKPLVVSHYTNMTRYVSEYNAGICLKENTPLEIAESMHQISQMMLSGELKAIGENARRMAEENFDWRMIAQKMLNAYVT